VEYSSHLAESSSGAVESSSHLVESSIHVTKSSSHVAESSSQVAKSSSRLAESSRIKQVFYGFKEGFSRISTVEKCFLKSEVSISAPSIYSQGTYGQSMKLAKKPRTLIFKIFAPIEK
jgi:hypothetical protein